MKPTIKREQIAAMNWHYRRYSLDYFLDCVERAGYTSVALWAGPPHFHIDCRGTDDVRLLRRKLEDRHLKCVSFTAAASQPMYQIGAYGRKHQEDTVRYFQNGAMVAAELGCKLLTANSGNGFFDEAFDEVWARSIETMARVCDAAAQYGVTVTMEGLRPQETRTASGLSAVKQFISDVNRPNCKAMIDTTAMAVNGETIWDWFRAFNGEILNTHFIDAAPAGHLAWGDGILPLEKMLTCLNWYGYAGPLGLEITHSRYFLNPIEANIQSLRVLSPYICD